MRCGSKPGSPTQHPLRRPHPKKAAPTCQLASGRSTKSPGPLSASSCEQPAPIPSWPLFLRRAPPLLPF
eukprot:2683-Chlamydomonas_euryale.AAC.2